MFFDYLFWYSGSAHCVVTTPVHLFPVKINRFLIVLKFEMLQVLFQTRFSKSKSILLQICLTKFVKQCVIISRSKLHTFLLITYSHYFCWIKLLLPFEIPKKKCFFTVPRLSSLFLLQRTQKHNVQQYRFSILTLMFDCQVCRYLHF